MTAARARALAGTKPSTRPLKGAVFMKNQVKQFLTVFALLALPALVQAQLSFTTNSGAITITGYNTAAGLDVVIPD
jgi:hypothetical protein